MISLEKTGNAIKFTFDDNGHYLQDGTIEVPVNSLTLVTDDSDMFTFKKSATNDIFVSGLYSEIGMTKSELETFYKDNMVGSTGGGSGSGITSGEVQTMIDESVSGKADVSAATIVNQTSGTVTGSTATTYGGPSITLNFAYNDGVTSFSGGCVGMVAFDNPRTPVVKYTTIDGVVKNAERGSDTDEYTYSNVARKVVITMKGNNRLTYVLMGYEDPVTINYTYDYVRNQSVAASTYIENTINPKLDEIETSLSGKADTSAVTAVNNVVTAHTADTTIHVTSADKTAWNAKSNFSGSYNDLTDKPTIPTVPTSNTAFTNDAGYITEDALSGYAESSAVTEEITAAVSGKQDTLSAGTNITISGNVISAEGGGKAVSGGTNISITTGETADTINCTLPYYKLNDNDNYSIFGNNSSQSFINKATNAYQSMFIGFSNEVKGDSSSKKYYDNFVIGNNNIINGHITDYSKGYNVVIGDHNRLSGTNLSDSYVIGKSNSGYTSNTLLTGWYNQAYNYYEFALGKYNASNTGSTDADKTFFSIGNGTADNARHNAFEIRQNGDIYLTLNGQDVKLQDQLGGSSITVDTVLDSGSTNPVENRVIYNKIDEVEQVTAAAMNNINDRLSEDEEVTAAGLNAVNDKFGGLKFVKLTQTEYNALATKDASTLYIIVN